MEELEGANDHRSKLKYPRTEGHSFPNKMVSPVSNTTDENNPIAGTVRVPFHLTRNKKKVLKHSREREENNFTHTNRNVNVFRYMNSNTRSGEVEHQFLKASERKLFPAMF